MNEVSKQFWEEGAVFPLRAISTEDAGQALEAYLRLCSTEEHVLTGEDRVFPHVALPWVADLIQRPAILDAVRDIIGPNVLVWVSEFNAKAPFSAKFFSWHQDLFYWKHQYADQATIPMVTVWLALSRADTTNGGMRIIPGSHRELVSHEERPSENNLLTRAQWVSVDVDESSAVAINLEPGEFSVHHPLMFHASGPNEGPDLRVGLVVRFMAPEIVPPHKPAYAWLVSGEDKERNWDLVAPVGQSDAAGWKRRCMESVQGITGARFK